MSRVVRPTRPGPNPGAASVQLRAAQRLAASRARRETLAIARAGAPGSFRGAGMTASTTRTELGVEVRVSPRRNLLWRAVFPEAGTGVYGPHRRLIVRRRRNARTGRPLPFRLPNGVVTTEIQGQRAQRFMERARPRAAAAAARAIIDAGNAAIRRATGSR